MKRWLLLAGIVVLAACGGGGGGNGGGGGGNASLAGVYSGEFVIGNSNPFVSETVTLTIDGAGKVTGETTGTFSSGAPGGKGTLTGTITGTVLALQSDLTFASAALGTYSAKGTGGVYNTNGKEIAIQINASKGGTFVGSFVLTAKQ